MQGANCGRRAHPESSLRLGPLVLGASAVAALFGGSSSWPPTMSINGKRVIIHFIAIDAADAEWPWLLDSEDAVQVECAHLESG